ncbi:hypothetical protein ACFRKD_26965 [Streptomyces niveus]|uniref:hypothetical protein n=1 Tax=Streptomyces niveus TaxID=193462 RepID=UPI0036811B7F
MSDRPRSYPTVDCPDGALGPFWDTEGHFDGPADSGATRLMTLVREASAPAARLPGRDTMHEAVALVLDGRHAPATVEALGVLVDLLTRYLDQLVRSAQAPGGGPQLDDLAEKGRRLLTERASDGPRRNVVRLAGAVRDLMAAVEPGGGS